MTIRSEIGFLKKCRSFEFFFLRRGHAQVKREESARGKTSARGRAPRLSRLTPGTFLYPPKKRKNDPCTTGC